jgi:putative N6-adenine-specific DNA methylase
VHTKQLQIFVITAPGLEPFAAAEVEQLGLKPRAENGGVTCSGSLEDVMRLNLWLRTASRVLVRVASFHASEFHELERRARRIDWTRFVAGNSRVQLRVTCRKSKLFHSDAVAQRVFDAIAKSVPGVRMGDSEPDEGDEGAATDGATQSFVVRLLHDEVMVSADTSGALLHRRGYRLRTAKAPMRETLAAGMLIASKWDANRPLLDPMCGSGTVAIEAALLARRIAPGRNRQFAFEQWPEFDAEKWSSLTSHADAQKLPSSPAQIFASDRDAGAVEAARENAERAGVAADISVDELPMSEAIVRAGVLPTGVLVTNPPYGKRVSGGADPRNLYASLGKLSSKNLPGWELVIMSDETRLLSQTGLTTRPLFRSSNGGIAVEVVSALTPA